jgi:predicted nucleotidyltransferase
MMPDVPSLLTARFDAGLLCRRHPSHPGPEEHGATFVYGSIPKGEDTAASDIDLMVVGDRLTYADLFAAVEDASARLGRKVSPTIYTPRELSKRRKQDAAFVTRVLAQPKLWLIGDDRVLAA